MRIKAIRDSFVGAPKAVAACGSPESNTFITLGKEYTVYAIAVFQGVVSMQIVNDVNIIDWLPSWFFEISEATVPNDWISDLPGEDLQLVLGPKFVAADEPSYNRMVELEPESVAAFWDRADAIAQTENES